MTIQLTEQQQQALARRADEPVRVVDPSTNTDYVLVKADEFESVREILDDEKQQRAIRAAALRNAAGRLNDE